MGIVIFYLSSLGRSRQKSKNNKENQNRILEELSKH